MTTSRNLLVVSVIFTLDVGGIVLNLVLPQDVEHVEKSEEVT